MAVSTRSLNSPDPVFQKWSSTSIIASSIVGYSNGDKDVREICCSEGFLKNPTDHLICLMVSRGIEGVEVEDSAMAFVMGSLPKAVEEMTNPRYLLRFAERRVKNHQKSSKVMGVFKRILESDEYIRQLEKAWNSYEERVYCDAEKNTRRALNVFRELKILDVKSPKIQQQGE
ncbi:MAG: hypothetical protein Q8L98_00720 [Chlamydiales bacterium]|nr:hypothetical protein [Chlamydiales bacterium]